MTWRVANYVTPQGKILSRGSENANFNINFTHDCISSHSFLANGNNQFDLRIGITNRMPILSQMLFDVFFSKMTTLRRQRKRAAFKRDNHKDNPFKVSTKFSKLHLLRNADFISSSKISIESVLFVTDYVIKKSSTSLNLPETSELEIFKCSSMFPLIIDISSVHVKSIYPIVSQSAINIDFSRIDQERKRSQLKTCSKKKNLHFYRNLSVNIELNL